MISLKKIVLANLVVALVLTLTFMGLGGVKPASTAPMNVLAAPAMVSPADGEQIAFAAQPFVFNWDAVSGATQYRLQISTRSSFSTYLSIIA